MNQVLTRNMLNYLTFWVSNSVLEAEVFVLRFMSCGKLVINVPVETENICSCKVTIPLWIGCNELKEADKVLLIADEEVSAESPVSFNNI